jgi:hypothetical protein
MVYFLNQLGSCQHAGLLELYNTGLNIQIQKETGIKKKSQINPLACMGFIMLVQMV